MSTVNGESPVDLMPHEQTMSADICNFKELLLCCPFCGSTNLTRGFWSFDEGEVDSVECDDCFAGAPLEAWNKRK